MDDLRSSLDPHDVSPDGQRFLMIQVQETASPDHLNLVLGWSSEIAARLP